MKKILEAIHPPAHQEKNGRRVCHTMGHCRAVGISGLSLLRPTPTNLTGLVRERDALQNNALQFYKGQTQCLGIIYSKTIKKHQGNDSHKIQGHGYLGVVGRGGQMGDSKVLVMAYFLKRGDGYMGIPTIIL